jgi:hypothetical protein
MLWHGGGGEVVYLGGGGEVVYSGGGGEVVCSGSGGEVACSGGGGEVVCSGMEVVVAKLYALVVVARVPQKSVKNPAVVLLISTARHMYSMQGYHSAFSSLYISLCLHYKKHNFPLGERLYVFCSCHFTNYPILLNQDAEQKVSSHKRSLLLFILFNCL